MTFGPSDHSLHPIVNVPLTAIVHVFFPPQSFSNEVWHVGLIALQSVAPASRAAFCYVSAVLMHEVTQALGSIIKKGTPLEIG